MRIVKNLYDHLDNQVMNHVNAGVRVWNWTTGRTKSQLASTFAYVTPVLVTIGAISYEDPFIFITPPVYFGIAKISSKVWKIQEEREISATKKQMIDPLAEKIKFSSERLGLVAGFFGLIESVVPLYMFGDFSLSAGCYVSRADSVSPRKDCVRRGLDKLVEAWNNRKEEQALPEPA